MWKVKDFCFCEYKLQEIKKVTKGHIQEVCDGYFSLSSGSLNNVCFPVNLRIKRISDEFAMYSNKIHKLNYNTLNYPDIHRYLVREWVKTCEHKDKDEYIKNMFDKLNKFYNTIREEIAKQSEATFEGVRLFK